MSAPPTPWLRRLPRRPVEPHRPVEPRQGLEPRQGIEPHRIDVRHHDAEPRRRPAPPVPAPAPAPAPPTRPAPAPAPAETVGLTVLAPPSTAAPAPAAPTRRGAALTLVPPPGVVGTVTLDPEDPVVRLDALQSGVGALVVRGADRVAWEDVAERTGVVSADGTATGDEMPRHGNRSLLRPMDGDLLVTLRHVRALRRLLVEARPDTAVTLTPYCSGTVRAADPAARLRLSVVVVDGRLEVRAEYGLPDDWRAALAAMGWSPLASVPRPAPDDWV